MMATDKWIIWSVFGCICWFFFTPVLCYCTYKFVKYSKIKENIAIHKRYSKLAIAIAIFGIIMVSVERPLYLLRYTLNAVTISIDSKGIPTSTLVIYYVQEVLGDLVTIPAAWLLLLRYWLIHYKVKWTKNTLDSKWKIHLNHNQVKTNWYLKNKSKYGNVRWMLLRLVIFLVITISINIFSEIVFPNKGFILWTIISFFLILFPMIFPVILFVKMRKFEDKFYIIKEFKYITINMLIGTVLYLIIGASPSFGVSVYFRGLMVAIMAATMQSISIMIQIWWVIHIVDTHFNNDGNKLSAYQKHQSQSALELGDLSNNSSRSPSNSQSSMVAMETILKEENSFELFMDHLAKEWSMELLLALIEITQIQNMIKKYANDIDMKLLAVQESLLQNEIIPKSYIVHHKFIQELMDEYNIQIAGKKTKMIEFKIKLYILYTKYVVLGSELQINISYEQKMSLDSFLVNINYFINNSMTSRELFELYHDITVELTKLLTHSYYRFSR